MATEHDRQYTLLRVYIEHWHSCCDNLNSTDFDPEGDRICTNTLQDRWCIFSVHFIGYY